MNVDQIKTDAIQKVLTVIRDLCAKAKERNLPFYIDHVGPVVKYTHRFLGKREMYRLEELCAMSVLAAAGKADYHVTVTDNQGHDFLTPQVDNFNGLLENKTFRSFNKKLDLFLEQNLFNSAKVVCSLGENPGLNDDPRNFAYANVATYHPDGSWNRSPLSKNFFYYSLITDKIGFDILEGRGEDKPKYVAFSETLKAEYESLLRDVFIAVQSEILTIAFKEEVGAQDGTV